MAVLFAALAATADTKTTYVTKTYYGEKASGNANNPCKGKLVATYRQGNKTITMKMVDNDGNVYYGTEEQAEQASKRAEQQLAKAEEQLARAKEQIEASKEQIAASEQKIKEAEQLIKDNTKRAKEAMKRAKEAMKRARRR